MYELIPFVTVPENKIGDFTIKRKTIPEDPMLAARMKRDGRNYVPGTYTYLFRNNTLVMSDTPDEKKDHRLAVKNTEGNCLIAGLGIGMVLNAIALKPEVLHIDVVEVSQEVIDLVSDHYNQLYPGKISFHCASIFDWNPVKGVEYNMAWYDIWDNFDTNNLSEMTKLHRKFGKKVEWQGSWSKELLQRYKKLGW